MRPIATDTHDFPSLRRDGKIYVDKTMFIHRLVADNDTRLFFMSRPRRFGKSLTVSALKALFSARRELFRGLYIDKTDWKWEKYPIIHFEFNDLSVMSIEEFEKNLANHVEEKLLEAGFSYDRSRSAHESQLAPEGKRGWGQLHRETFVLAQNRHRLGTQLPLGCHGDRGHLSSCLFSSESFPMSQLFA